MCWERQSHLSKGLCGSEPYIAPEEFEEKEYSAQAVDIWSCGIVYYCMAFQGWYMQRFIFFFFLFAWKSALNTTNDSCLYWFLIPLLLFNQVSHSRWLDLTIMISNITWRLGKVNPMNLLKNYLPGAATSCIGYLIPTCWDVPPSKTLWTISGSKALRFAMAAIVNITTF